MQRRRLTVTTVAAASLIAAPVTTAFAMPTGSGDREVTLSSAVPAWVAAPSATTPHVTGRAAASSQVDVSLQLPMRNQRLAEQYVAQGTVISEAEYDRTFGTTQAQVDKVARWLRARGITVTSTDRASGAVNARASVSTLQRGLRTTLATAQLRGRRGLVAVKAPTLPASLGVSTVVGLNSMMLTTPHHVTRPALAGDRSTDATATGSSILTTPHATAPERRCANHWGDHVNTSSKPFVHQSNYLCGYLPQDLPRMYGVTGAAAQAPTIAIIGAYNVSTMKTITNQYMARFHYPQLTSYTAYPSTNERRKTECGGTSSWGQEQALDVQSSHSIAPKAKILYYGSRSCGLDDMLTTFQRAVKDRKATTVSMSFGTSSDAGQDPSLLAAWNKATLQASLAGISVFASSGDDGDNSQLNPGGAKGVGVPSAYPYVTSVGGTAEGMTAQGKVVVRTGWEDLLYKKTTGPYSKRGFIGGAGGGVSSRVSQPTWQRGKVPAGKRAVPDVAALADPFTGFATYYGGTLSATGGTSLATPVVAAVVALSKSRTGRKVGLASPSLYKMLGTSALNDVRALSSTGVYVPGDPTGVDPGRDFVIGFDRKPQGDLQSKSGWDNVTGVGTPNGAAFLSAFGK
jgi:subtilase family serine protease